MPATAPTPQREMRHRNLSRVLRAVADHGPASRAGLASRIGLTRAAVSTLVDELLRAGLLVELGPGPGGGVGRPGSALALPVDGPCGLGAEVGVDHLTVCAVDLRGQVRARVREPSAHGDGSPARVLARLVALAAEVSGEVTAAGLRPAGLAVAVPGLVARGTTTVVRAPNLGWSGVDVAAHVRSDAGTGPLPLTVENEANLGALAEMWLGGRNAEGWGNDAPRDFIHVSAQAGIGAAVVLDGELLRGTRGFAGELGHVPVRPDGPACPCGGRGCLEQYAGEAAVMRAAGAGSVPPGGRREALGALTGRAAAGDPAVRRALRGAGKALGIALAGAVNLVDPRHVVLGGAFAPLGPWLLPAMERELEQRTAARGSAPRIVLSGPGSDGPLLGAAHSVVRAVLDHPAQATRPLPSAPARSAQRP